MAFSIFYFACAAVAASFVAKRVAGCGGAAVRALAFLVFVTVLLIVPVQALAWLKIVGVVDSIRFDHLAALQAVVLAAAYGLRARTPVRPWASDFRSLSRAVRSAPVYILAAAAAVVGAYGLAAIDLATSYPEGWDALGYHLPMTLSWFQDRTLAITATTHWRRSLPGNAEIGAFLIYPTGKESLLPAIQWIALGCLGIAAYSIASRLARSRTVAALTVLIAMTLPIVYFQSVSAYVDLFGTGFLLAAAALARSWMERWREGPRAARGLLAASALACGLALGSKPTFWLYALFYVAAMLLWILWPPRRKPRAVLAVAALLVAGMAIPSGFWFARAAYGTGNPIFPFEVKIGERVLLAGVPSTEMTRPDWSLGRFVRTPAEWLVYPWVEYKNPLGLTTYSAEGGVGAAFATFAPLGLFYCLWGGAQAG